MMASRARQRRRSGRRRLPSWQTGDPQDRDTGPSGSPQHDEPDDRQHDARSEGIRCDAESQLDEDERTALAQGQRDLLAELVPGAVLAGLGDNGSGWAGQIFDEPATPEDVTVSVVPASASVPAIPGTGPTLADAAVTDGLAVTFCPEGYYTPMAEPGTEPCHRPELSLLVGQPSGLAVVWDRAGAPLTLPVSGAEGQTLRLRAFADPADERLPDGDITLRLTADDGSTSQVVLPVPPTLRFYAGTFDIAASFLPWQTTTWTLNASVEEVTIEVIEPEQGALQLVSLGVD